MVLLRSWAEKRVATGNEPPWAWYQYMKLIETLTAIQAGRAAVTPATAGSLAVGQGAAPRRNAGEVADEVADIDTRRRRRRREDPPLPM
jgi:hypothetical protein